MKISYNELNTNYFDGKLPPPDTLAEALTFHAWEIEGVEQVGDDTVLDVKVLPDKSAWALSHRGIAKDLSVILNIPLTKDPLRETPVLEPMASDVAVSVETETCTRYTAAYIRGVKIGESPEWLRAFLTSMGQRSINNVVDLTNYVMFGIGQPLHAFDAQKLSNNGGFKITVRNAHAGEHITTLTGEDYELTDEDALIVDGGTDTSIGIAGIKGGKVAEVDEDTVDIILESANFDPVKVRKTSQRLKLRTDASQRFENGVVRDMAGFGVTAGARFIVNYCGGEIIGYADTNPAHVPKTDVSLPLQKLNSVLGLSLTMDEVAAIIERFGYAYTVADDILTVTPPVERPDLVIPEDLIEEIGRVHGYEHVPSITIEPIPLREVNARFYYGEKVRDMLTVLGFSEIYTSSFRDTDEVKLKNALASDKGYLRSSSGMQKNMREALALNAPNADLFGAEQIRVFEIGTVFEATGERLMLTLGVTSKAGFSQKKDQKVLDAACTALKEVFGDVVCVGNEGVVQLDLEALIETLPKPATYTAHELSSEVAYKPFSAYPYMTRDVAFWVTKQSAEALATDHVPTEQAIQNIVKDAAGLNVTRIDMFDRFEKEGRVSYGFRIVFQSYEKTLESAVADQYMQSVYDALKAQGFEVR